LTYAVHIQGGEGNLLLKTICVSVALVAIGILSHRALAQVNVIMTGLDNPRGLTLGPDGGIYVAEAGRGGTGTTIVGGEGVNVQFGPTGAVSRYLGGVQSRVITGLPSLAPQTGPTALRATGLHHIVFSGGDLFGVIGLGGDPAKRAALAADSTSFGYLVRLPLGGAPVNIADVATFEATANPDGVLPDSNAYSLLPAASGFSVADAGANAVFSVTPAGVVSTLSVFPAKPNPLFPAVGGPTYQAVPTSLATGPDGALYVGQLTGFPFVPGAANVYRIDPITSAQTTAFTGFTNIIDLAFASDGDLLVLQLTTNGIGANPGPGRLIRIDSVTGLRSTLLDSPLFFPGGLLVTPNDSIYVSNLGTSGGGGQVLQLIPEPATCTLLVASLLLTLSRRRRVPEARPIPLRAEEP
jgi:hypothetical protein